VPRGVAAPRHGGGLGLDSHGQFLHVHRRHVPPRRARLAPVPDAAALGRFGFPAAQQQALREIARSGKSLSFPDADAELREAVRITLGRLAYVCPFVAWWEPDLGPAQPQPPPAQAQGSIVSRILRDLRAA
jgi:hypothetical protein